MNVAFTKKFAGCATSDALGGCGFLARILDVLPGIVYVFNHETQSSDFSNSGPQQILGYSDADIVAMGSDLMASICHPADLPNVLANFGRIKSLKDGEVARIEYRVRHKDRYWLWLQSLDTVFTRDSEGAVTRHIGSAQVISSQKNAQAEALQRAVETDAINADLRAFAYALSHDLKSPTNTLSLLLGELFEHHQDTLEPDALDLVKLAQKTTQNMHRRVGDTLDFVRIFGADAPKAPCNLNAVMQDVMCDIRAGVQESGAKIEIGPLPVVYGNAAHLQMLFQNLLENAIKFRRPGEQPIIGISSEEMSGGERLKISVTDNGIGIPKQHQNAVFDMYARLHRPEQYEGNGFGLAICRRIVLSHNGTISVHSDGQSGTTFEVILEGR